MTPQEKIEQTAARMVASHGLINLSLAELCEQAGISSGSFQHIMGCNFTRLVDRLRPHDSGGHRVKRRRTNPALRKDSILNDAVTLAAKIGYTNLTRNAVADKAGISCGLITHYFTSMAQLKKAVLRRAIKDENLKIISQALVNRDPIIAKIPADLKSNAAQSLVA